VYLETGFHPVKSEFDVLQQQQTATMEVGICQWMIDMSSCHLQAFWLNSNLHGLAWTRGNMSFSRQFGCMKVSTLVWLDSCAQCFHLSLPRCQCICSAMVENLLSAGVESTDPVEASKRLHCRKVQQWGCAWCIRHACAACKPPLPGVATEIKPIARDILRCSFLALEIELDLAGLSIVLSVVLWLRMFSLIVKSVWSCWGLIAIEPFAESIHRQDNCWCWMYFYCFG